MWSSAGVIGCEVRAGGRPFHGRVCAVFESALHACAGEVIVTIGGPKLPPHPYSVAWPGWHSLEVRRDDPVEVSFAELSVGCRRAPLGPMRTFRPRHAPRGQAGAVAIASALGAVRLRAAGLPWRGGLHGYFAPSGGDAWEGALLSAARPAIEEAQRAIRRRDFDGLRSAAGVLAGLGPGLTPSGDDFLGGLLAAVRFHAAGRGEPVAQAALDGVAEIVSNRTSAYSGFLVRCAARGMVSAPVERVLRAIQAGAPAVAAERGEAVAATGHSSGVDTLAGLVCGTEAALGAPL